MQNMKVLQSLSISAIVVLASVLVVTSSSGCASAPKAAEATSVPAPSAVEMAPVSAVDLGSSSAGRGR